MLALLTLRPLEELILILPLQILLLPKKKRKEIQRKFPALNHLLQKEILLLFSITKKV
jgi:hypothetical protein